MLSYVCVRYLLVIESKNWLNHIFDRPVRFLNQVQVSPGDIVVGDIDGVVIIPKSIENEVVAAALEKVKGESITRKRIQEGTSARQVWDELGIL